MDFNTDNQIVCFDMDGTLAKFYKDKEHCLERMFEQEFFLNLEPYKLARDLEANAAVVHWRNIYIVSACVNSPWCRTEKQAWISMWLPHVHASNIIFVDVGENKAEAVQQALSAVVNKKEFYLVDDYSRNLYEWESTAINFHAVKFINGFNNKNGNNYRRQIRTFYQLHTMLNAEEDI